jgi:hypothetical protein
MVTIVLVLKSRPLVFRASDEGAKKKGGEKWTDCCIRKNGIG